MNSHRDRAGEKYNRLTLIEPVGRTKNRNLIWKCKCDCGNYTNVVFSELKRNRTQSCGCLKVEKVSTHHESHTRLYGIWSGMKDRCFKESNEAYPHYGGRGITVCDEWLDYSNFSKWAKENGYEQGLTIDRINNDENYCPSNCRWVTLAEQNRNKSDTVLLECDGEIHCRNEWARIIGTSIEKFRYWINKTGEFEGKKYVRVN